MNRIVTLVAIAKAATLSQLCFAQAIPPVTPAASDDIIVLNPYEVSTEGDEGYAPRNTIGATRVNTDLIDTPISIAMVSAELLSDLNTTDYIDSVQFVSGVVRQGGPRDGQISIRGVYIDDVSSFRDGIPDRGFVTGFSLNDSIGLDRVEVIKGPSGTLFGAHPLGGIVNRVGKMPVARDFSEIGLEYQLYDSGEGYYRSTIDINRDYSKSAGSGLQMRLLASFRDGEEHHGGEDTLTNIIPMFAYRFQGGGKVWFRFEYLDGHVAQQRGAWFIDAADELPFGLVPVDRVPGNLGDPNEGLTQERYHFEVGHAQSYEFGSQIWNTRLVVRHAEIDGRFSIYLPQNKTVINGAGATVGRIGGGGRNYTFEQFKALKASDPGADIIVAPNFINRNRDFNGKETNFTYDANTLFSVGPTDHNFLAYLSYRRTYDFQHWFRYSWDAERQSIFNMQPRSPSAVLSKFSTENNGPEENDADFFNFGLQDSMTLFDEKVVAVVGARFDELRSQQRLTGTVNAPIATAPRETNRDWTYKFGAVYKPFAQSGGRFEDFSVFYNKSQTFLPRGGVNEIGEPYRNFEGLMDEVGIKFRLLDGRLSGTISYFDMEFTNQLVTSLEDVDGDGDVEQVTRQLGTVDTTGWEADIVYSPVQGLNFLLALQDIDSAELSGRRPRGTPVGFNWSVVANYTFEEGALKGTQIGVTHRSIEDRAGDASDTFTIPGYDVTGAWISYDRPTWGVQLNIDNLTDEEYVFSSINDFLIAPGRAINYKLSFRYRF
jgi:iron complex outermembrane receptor protein